MVFIHTARRVMTELFVVCLSCRAELELLGVRPLVRVNGRGDSLVATYDKGFSPIQGVGEKVTFTWRKI